MLGHIVVVFSSNDITFGGSSGSLAFLSPTSCPSSSCILLVGLAQGGTVPPFRSSSDRMFGYTVGGSQLPGPRVKSQCALSLDFSTSFTYS